MNFKSEFERIIAELEQHPEIEVYGSMLAGPATEDTVRGKITAMGIEPTDAMMAFYTTHNGAYLEWGLKGREYQTVGGLGGYTDYGTPPGVINILPVEDAFDGCWQQDYVINQSVGEETWGLAYNAPEPEEGETTAVMIDMFSIYYHTDLLLGPEPLLVVASDHGADLSCSDFMTFEQYLELVIAQYGYSPYDQVGIGWSRKATRLAGVVKPSLETIVEKAKAQEE